VWLGNATALARAPARKRAAGKRQAPFPPELRQRRLFRRRGRSPGATPQFIAKDLKEFFRLAGMTHVRTSPHYPQSNGKIERWHKTLKSDALRPAAPAGLEAARTTVAHFVDHYNHVRLHSAIGYIAPDDYMRGLAAAIWAERDRKLEAARQTRRERRDAARNRVA
jgi:putative transposase